MSYEANVIFLIMHTPMPTHSRDEASPHTINQSQADGMHKWFTHDRKEYFRHCRLDLFSFLTYVIVVHQVRVVMTHSAHHILRGR